MSNQIDYINNIKLEHNDLNNLYDVNEYINKISKIYNNDNDIVEIKKKNVRIEDINIIKQFHCDRCNTNGIIEDTAQGILVCKNCSIVKSHIVNFTSDWNNYNDSKKDKSRSSHPISALLPQSSTATVIAGSCSNRIKTLHNWNNMPYKERSLNETFKLIQEVCSIAKISKCIEDDAKIKFKLISDCKHTSGKNIGKPIIIRGENRKSLIAECLNEACNSKGLNRPPKEIAKLFGTKHTKGRKIYQKLMAIKNVSVKLNFPKPDSFIARFCNFLNLKKIYADQCLQIANNVQKIKIASVHNSLSIATGAVFLMSHINNLNITKKTIAEYFYVSQVTISKTFHKIEPFTKILINDEISDVIEKEIKKYQKNIKIHNSINFIRFNVDTKKYLNIDRKILLSVVKDDKILINKLLTQNVVLLFNKFQINYSFVKYTLKIINDMYELSSKNIKKSKLFTCI
jgi:transcription initiation factor TFIIIB Brf1 subunit/transcription initiation factor TFIIB